jgi:hypothetical protein
VVTQVLAVDIRAGVGLNQQANDFLAGTSAGLAGSSDEFAMLPFRKLSSFRSSERIVLD